MNSELITSCSQDACRFQNLLLSSVFVGNLKGQILCGLMLPHRETMCFSLHPLCLCLSVRGGELSHFVVSNATLPSSVWLFQKRCSHTKVMGSVVSRQHIQDCFQTECNKNNAPMCDKILYGLCYTEHLILPSVAIYLSDHGFHIVPIPSYREKKLVVMLVFICNSNLYISQ